MHGACGLPSPSIWFILFRWCRQPLSAVADRWIRVLPTAVCCFALPHHSATFALHWYACLGFPARTHSRYPTPCRWRDADAFLDADLTDTWKPHATSSAMLLPAHDPHVCGSMARWALLYPALQPAVGNTSSCRGGTTGQQALFKAGHGLLPPSCDWHGHFLFARASFSHIGLRLLSSLVAGFAVTGTTGHGNTPETRPLSFSISLPFCHLQGMARIRRHAVRM